MIRPVGTGLYRCGIAVVHRPRAAIRAFVPEWLEVPEPTPPVVLLFGEHRDVCVEGTSVPNLRYLETLVSVPGLRHPRMDGPVAWIARMHLSRTLPVWLGLPYGFPKQRSAMRGLPDPRVEGHLRARFTALGPSHVDPPDVHAVFDQPFVTRAAPGLPAMTVRMEFLPETRAIREARCEGTWTAPLRELDWDGPADAAWRFESRWRLHLPRPLALWRGR